MKLSIFYSLILILLLCSNIYAKAQNDSSYFEYSIKTNAFQWIMNEPNIAFEYRFSPKFGWENTLGTYGPFTRDIHTNMNETEPLPHKGITLRSNFKWYFAAGNHSLKNDVYLSPMLLLKYNTVDGYFSTIRSYEIKKENRFIAGLSILAGYQVLLGRINCDFFLGGGVRYRDLRGTIKSSVTSRYGSGGPPGYYPKNFKDSEWKPSVHAGIKLGFSFIKIN
ncbi:MAG: DUF3575 domain-containing protein [Sphingobacteriales bacterium]|nr:MAG: DUF3575 domain-containing protein [Sphingobacteriales bacterium]